jgi:hypothetical protein
MNFGLKCWPLASRADQVNDHGFDRFNVALVSINCVYMTPYIKDG